MGTLQILAVLGLSLLGIAWPCFAEHVSPPSSTRPQSVTKAAPTPDEAMARAREIHEKLWELSRKGGQLEECVRLVRERDPLLALLREEWNKTLKLYRESEEMANRYRKLKSEMSRTERALWPSRYDEDIERWARNSRIRERRMNDIAWIIQDAARDGDEQSFTRVK